MQVLQTMDLKKLILKNWHSGEQADYYQNDFNQTNHLENKEEDKMDKIECA